MTIDGMLWLNSLLFGVGLAADACMIAVATGMKFPQMSRTKIVFSACLFALFHALAAILGFLIARAVFKIYAWLDKVFAWIAVAIILSFGVRSITDTVKGKTETLKLGMGATVVQCAATALDALTVGFTIEEYEMTAALFCAAVIAVITFIACVAGFAIGKRFGMKFGKVASLVGGIMFIAIAVEIIVTTYI